ncbi:hypothetical protein [Paenarthrobacter sp. NPDC057981]|uniref:hypothetical protein n=1 Tax=Paenarthrobacter sp. NPDC057981 TaxID=3346297 RepID=UPI0036DDE150
MKKLTTVLIAAGLLVSASACSTQQQLSTQETCDRVNVAAAGISQNPSQTVSNRAANAVRPIEAVASDEMKPVVIAIREYLDEKAKKTPDEARLGELTTGFQESVAKFGQLCTGGQ